MPEGIFYIFIVLAIAWVAFVLLTKRGKGIMFGGKIVKTYEGVTSKHKIFSNTVKVHAVDGGSIRLVGLEISSSSIGSYQSIPVTFPADEARQLAQMLIEASEYGENA